jgi:hypothetical protein
MSRPTQEDLRLMDRLTRAVNRLGPDGCGNVREFSFDRYVIRQWGGRTALLFTGWGEHKPVFTWDHTTKEIELRESIHLPGVVESLDHLLILDDLADA